MVDTTFGIILLVHILAAVVAFGGNFIQPMLQRAGADNAAMAKVNKLIQLPSLGVLFVAGIGLILTGDGFEFSHMWISVAFLVAIVAMVLQYLVARAYENDSPAAIPGLIGGLHLCLIVALYLMIWQPGA